jgi:hypothetical protein
MASRTFFMYSQLGLSPGVLADVLEPEDSSLVDDEDGGDELIHLASAPLGREQTQPLRKTITTFLPLSAESVTLPPWMAGRVKSGAGCSRRAGLTCGSWASAGGLRRVAAKAIATRKGRGDILFI